MLDVASPHDERLPPPRAPGDALADALAATLETVAAAVADPDPEEMVHDARKAMKQYRALLRLIPGDDAKAERRRTAEVARALSGARDQVAARDALEVMAKGGFLLACDQTDAAAALGEDAAEDGGEHRATLGGFLVSARTLLAETLAAQAREADVPKGLVKAYKQARRAPFDTPEAMHEARKRVVTHRYQMSFLAEAFGHGAKRARAAQRLRDLLGAYQDIETLRPMLDAAGAALEDGTRERLGLAMDRAQKRLRKRALRQHAALFRHSAKAFRATCREQVGAASD